MDSCIVPIRDNTFLIQTTDFFTPLVDDPYLTGRISACNVLSDLYACGVSKCDNVLMLLGACTKFTPQERDAVVPMMMEGFNDACREAGTLVRGGHSTVNPWPIIGGVATSVSQRSEFVMPVDAKIGQKIVLTKPLGTQVAVNLHQWMDQGHKFYGQLENSAEFDEDSGLCLEKVTKSMFNDACVSMATLNQKSAAAMTKFPSCSSATDVTGFGLLGHAENLAKAQNDQELSFKISALPILKHADLIDQKFAFFKLRKGFSAETSGGLLVTIDGGEVEGFCSAVAEGTGIRPWVVGEVVSKQSAPNQSEFAFIDENAKIIPVEGLAKNA